MDVREILEAVAEGDMNVADAEAELRGYTIGDAGRYDAARIRRRGLMEAVFAPGKTPGEVADLAADAVRTTGRALITRSTPSQQAAVVDRFSDDEHAIDVSVYDRSDTIVVRDPATEVSTIPALVGIVSGGTADSGPVEEAAIVLEELGIAVDRFEDVGVANLTRVVDQLASIRECDVAIVAAGREGALPTIVAGLVDIPIIGLPISSGYGYGGDGEAALMGMLQSCTVLSVVNIDAGFVAGAQAGLVARAIAHERDNRE